MDRKRGAMFSPRRHCTGCVFTSNVDMLDDWKRNGIGSFTGDPLHDEDFV
jgi:hypothetical protein